ncbi:hypothetical protein DFH06DRAFT_1353052 [Mycena polygramma]|nr:hypothetical protein DFH06DRAFT_1353052 [Mycena polygramma]
MEISYEKHTSEKIAESPCPWRMHEVYNVPYCNLDCPICKPYIRHLSLAYDGMRDDPDWCRSISPEEDKKDEEEAEVENQVQQGNGWEPPLLGSATALTDTDDTEDQDDEDDETPDRGLKRDMHTLFMLQSSRGREETGQHFLTDPAVLGHSQRSLAVLAMKFQDVHREKEAKRATILALEQEIHQNKKLHNELSAELLLSDSGYPRKRRLVSAPGDSPLPDRDRAIDIQQTVTEMVAHASKLSVRSPHRHAGTNDKSQKRSVGQKMPTATASPEEFARWIQASKSKHVKGVPASPPNWDVDLRDARGHQAMMTMVPPRGAHQRSKRLREERMQSFIAVLRILIIPGQYAQFIKTYNIPIASGPLSAWSHPRCRR